MVWVRASFLPIMVALTALALSGCQTTSPVAGTPGAELDAMAYGGPAAHTPAAPATAPAGPAPAAATADNSGNGAIAALRKKTASSSRTYVAEVPVVYAAPMPRPVAQPVRYDSAYHLDAGDKLRVVVFGQEGLTNTYAIDAAGSITMPLIGAVSARGRTPAGLATEITARLRNGYIREPSVAVEIDSYRPFFILGEVQAPGQYPYVPNMTVESAVAIAGGFTPRAKRSIVTVTHTDAGGSGRYLVPMGTSLSPGDTVLVGERWF
jgi:polysaccharide export outer membrane protein